MERFSRSALFCAILCLSSSLIAGNRPESITGTVGLGTIYLSTNRPVENSGLGFFGLGYNFTYHWGIDGLLGFFTSKSRRASDNGKQVNGTILAFDALYRFSPFYNFEAFVLAGPGVTGLSPNGEDSRNQANINVGLGLQYFMNDSLAFRAEARDLYTLATTQNAYMWDAGITYVFGGAKKKTVYKDS